MVDRAGALVAVCHLVPVGLTAAWAYAVSESENLAGVLPFGLTIPWSILVSGVGLALRPELAGPGFGLLSIGVGAAINAGLLYALVAMLQRRDQQRRSRP